MSFQDPQPQVIRIAREKELQIIVDSPSNGITVELLEGSAELLGASMIANKIYTLTSSFSVVTLNGCRIKLSGYYKQKRFATAHRSIHDLHKQLESCRCAAEKAKTKGPISLIVGPVDVGKSTVCRSLLNYAAHNGRSPMFIDLDVGQTSTSIPGTVSIASIEGPSDLIDGIGDDKLSVYFFGYKGPDFNINLYYRLLEKLGRTLNHRFSLSEKVNYSGAIVDTCGWVTGRGYESILVAAKSFNINVIIVIADKTLYSNLRYDTSPEVEIIFVPKLTGVVTRNRTTRISNRNEMLREYFYGASVSLTTFTFDIKFSDVKIFSLLRDYNGHGKIPLEQVTITSELVGEVVAISHASDINEDVALTSVLGFICVKNVDMLSETLTILCPQPSPLPNYILLKGDMKMSFK